MRTWGIVILVVALPAVHALADPERPLGMSSRGITRWPGPVIEVTPTYYVVRGRLFSTWDATIDGSAIDHARFYELVDGPDLVRRTTVRRVLGAGAAAAGVAVSVLGGHFALHNDLGVGLPLLFGGFLGATFSTVFLVLGADSVSAPEAQQLVDNTRRFSLGLGGRF